MTTDVCFCPLWGWDEVGCLDFFQKKHKIYTATNPSLKIGNPNLESKNLESNIPWYLNVFEMYLIVSDGIYGNSMVSIWILYGNYMVSVGGVSLMDNKCWQCKTLMFKKNRNPYIHCPKKILVVSILWSYYVSIWFHMFPYVLSPYPKSIQKYP